MCPPLLVAAVVIAAAGAAASIAANSIADAAARGDHEEAMRLRREAQAKYSAVELANIDKILAQKLGPTELASLNIDPTGRNAQMAALDKFKALMNNAGMDPQARLAFMNAQSEAGRLESGMTGRLNQEMAQRGLQGSGMQYAGQLQAQQSGLNRAAQMQTQASSDAAQRSFGAAQQVGSLGGEMRNQDYTQARDRAMAQDAINKWNAEQTDSNARYNNYIEQQQFNNRMQKLEGETGQTVNMANAMQQQADADRAAGQRQGAAINSGAQSVAGAVAGLGNTGSTASDAVASAATSSAQPTTTNDGFYVTYPTDWKK